MPELTKITWPDNGTPALPPALSGAELQRRFASFRRAGSAYDALVVYGDREHAANIHWLTGFDPRQPQLARLAGKHPAGWLQDRRGGLEMVRRR